MLRGPHAPNSYNSTRGVKTPAAHVTCLCIAHEIEACIVHVTMSLQDTWSAWNTSPKDHNFHWSSNLGSK
jgi:hypothetical protein